MIVQSKIKAWSGCQYNAQPAVNYRAASRSRLCLVAADRIGFEISVGTGMMDAMLSAEQQ
ncbi:MAG: hypothetical protein A2107_10190 [Verrucomicrobia bacterium GWF2_62_7]|nr:MAG: hypothetical protein A2107_10190 [Verrucomicrobia bacterium GWF2_62_7]